MRRFRTAVVLFGFSLLFFGLKSVALADGFPLVTNVAQLRRVLTGNTGLMCSFSLEGTVLAGDSGLIFFQDDSGTEILETTGEEPLQPGQRIRLRGTNYLVATEIGLSLGKLPVVDNDGRHGETACAGTVYLRAGRYPIQLPWFNYTGTGSLHVTLSGPKISRQPLPESALFRLDESQHFVNGLNYRCYEGQWQRLPHFQSLTSVKSGVAPGFNVNAATRQEYVGMVFDGFLQVERDGDYTFNLNSDDGSQLFIQNTPAELKVMGSGDVPAPKRIALRQPSLENQPAFWAEAEGVVTFLGMQRNRAELELTAADTHMRLVVCSSSNEPPRHLLGSRVRVRGLCLDTTNIEGHSLADVLVVPNWTSLEILEATPKRKLPSSSEGPTNALPLLTTAAQVQQLKRDEAKRGYTAHIQGVVTWVAENRDCIVIQDATRGVFVGLHPAWVWGSPRIGENLEIEGTTIAGDFSPIVILTKAKRLGMGALPSPIHPTWDQLIAGSLDSQYVEIRGLITGVHGNQVTLLMSGGTLEIEFDPHPADMDLESLVDSVVRIRGCMFAKWDNALQVTPDHPLWFSSATICVDTPAPLDLFDAVKMRARDLMRFDAQGNLFRRVKIAGQILQGNGQSYYLTDDDFGMRFQLAQPSNFEPGDNVEAVGLVELVGASPVLREAIARKTGHAPLPEPKPLTFERNDRPTDATRVWVEGLLVGINEIGPGRELEIQVGLKSFVARLAGTNGNSIGSWPLGSRLKLTGVYADLGGNRPTGSSASSFALLVNSPSDIVLVARPQWWTLNRVLAMAGVLAAGLVLAFIWIDLLRHQVERRTAQLNVEISQRERAEHGRAIEQERARIARDLHDDLGSSLTVISMLAMTGRVNAQSSVDRLHLISEKTRLMVTTLDELVWAVNPKNDTLAAMGGYLANFAKELLAQTKIACRIELPLEFPEQTVAAETRHNVLLSVREALNNAVRHSQASEVLLQLTLAPGAGQMQLKDPRHLSPSPSQREERAGERRHFFQKTPLPARSSWGEGTGDTVANEYLDASLASRELAIVIQDNGCGFDPGAVQGNGLVNLQERMRKVKGRCRIESLPGKGTTVCLTLSM